MKVQNKNLFSWLVYDFGNSFFVTAISGLFLAQWLIIDNKLDDIWYGAGFAIATIFVLITSPYFGAWSDRINKRMPFLKLATIGLFVFNFLMAAVAVTNLPVIFRAFSVLVLSIFVQYLYQMSLIFYNSLLKSISTDKTRGAVSGIGEAFNNFGWLVGSVVLLPFANGAITLIGQTGRAQVFLPAFIISSLLMLPILFMFKEKETIEKNYEKKQTVSLLSETINGVKQLFKTDRNVGVFLIAFALISDIILTLNLYFAVVMDSLYHVNDTVKTTVFGVNLICAMFMGYLLGKLGDRYGHKIIVFITCIILIVIMSILFLSHTLPMLYLVAIIGGAGSGGYYVVTRSLMIKISPQNKLGEYFGFYSTFQRVSSVIAPLVWGGITLALRDRGPLKYQVAGLVMVGLLVIGTLILLKVKEPKSAMILV